MFNLVNKHFKTVIELQPCLIGARTPTGPVLHVLGTTSEELDLGDCIWYVDCYVVFHFKYSFLLGTDLMSCKKLDLGNMQIKIRQQYVPVNVLKRPSQVPVCFLDSLELLTGSEADLAGSVTGLRGTIIVQPKHEIASKESSLIPARCIASVDDGQIPIRIANTPNYFPVKIFAGTFVGWWKLTMETLKMSMMS